MSITRQCLPKQIETFVINTTGTTVELATSSPGKQLKIWGMSLTFGGGGTVTFKSGSTALTGAMNMTSYQLDPPRLANGVIDAGFPYFETAEGEAFNVVLSASGAVAGVLYYTAG